MSAILFELPDDLAARLRGREQQIPEMLEIGLRQFDGEVKAGYEGTTEVLKLLAGLPSPEEILRLRPSERLQRKIEDLLARSQAGPLGPQDEQEWERYEFLEHLVRMAKIKAASKVGIDSQLNASS